MQVSNSVDDGSGRLDDTQASKTPKTNKKETTIERGDPLYSEILEWLQEFMEILVDDEIPVHGDSHASSSHEPSLERSYPLPERPKLKDLPEDQNHKTSVQKTHWRSRTSC